MVLLLTDLPGDVLPTLGRALASENAVQALRAACRSMYTAPGLLVHYRALTATVAIATFHDASMATNAIYSTRRHPQAATATQIYLRVVQNLVNTPLNDPRPWEALGTIAIPCPDGGKDDGNDADAVAAMLAIPAAADSPDMVPRVCSLLSRNGSAVPENLWVPFTMALVLRQMRVYAALRGPDGAVYKCLGSVKGDAVRARFVAGYSPESRHQSMNAFDLVLGLEDMDNIPQVLAAINAIESLILRYDWYAHGPIIQSQIDLHLVRNLSHPDPAVSLAALKAVASLASVQRTGAAGLVKAGAIPVLISRIGPDYPLEIRHRAMWALREFVIMDAQFRRQVLAAGLLEQLVPLVFQVDGLAAAEELKSGPNATKGRKPKNMLEPTSSVLAGVAHEWESSCANAADDEDLGLLVRMLLRLLQSPNREINRDAVTGLQALLRGSVKTAAGAMHRGAALGLVTSVPHQIETMAAVAAHHHRPMAAASASAVVPDVQHPFLAASVSCLMVPAGSPIAAAEFLDQPLLQALVPLIDSCPVPAVVTAALDLASTLATISAAHVMALLEAGVLAAHAKAFARRQPAKGTMTVRDSFPYMWADAINTASSAGTAGDDTTVAQLLVAAGAVEVMVDAVLFSIDDHELSYLAAKRLRQLAERIDILERIRVAAGDQAVRVEAILARLKLN